MTFTRREAFAVLAGAGVLSGCGNLASQKKTVPPPTSLTDPATRLIARAGFGARPGETQDVRELGADGWIASQLRPDGHEPFGLSHRLSRLDIFRFSAWELRDWKEDDIIGQLQQAALLSAALSPWQVRERMIDFWSNHFNIYAKKGLSAYRLPSAYRNVIQANALGSFPKMLHASAKSTAMLLYLDQQASHRGNPNENYARELLELHTLGVDAGYSQKDVMEVARCFTGWTEERRFLREKGSFRFFPQLHDSEEKLVLGEVIPAGGGVKDGERVLDILARHPATARHLARKLVKFFLGREDVALEVAVEDAYWGEQLGDISAMVKTVLSSPALLDGPPAPKRPFDYVVSALRATDSGFSLWPKFAPILGHLDRMGQPLHLWPMPDGYPVDADAWGGSMLARWNFAFALTSNGIGGVSVDLSGLAKRYGASSRNEWIAAVFGLSQDSQKAGSLMATLQQHTVQNPSTSDDWAQIAALCLCSPEFQWR